MREPAVRSRACPIPRPEVRLKTSTAKPAKKRYSEIRRRFGNVSTNHGRGKPSSSNALIIAPLPAERRRKPGRGRRLGLLLYRRPHRRGKDASRMHDRLTPRLNIQNELIKTTYIDGENLDGSENGGGGMCTRESSPIESSSRDFVR
jgi:hypothetical protein